MSISTLVTVLMITHFVCSYLLVFRYTNLAHKAQRVTAISFRFKWCERMAGTYVLALPVFLLLTYVVGKL